MIDLRRIICSALLLSLPCLNAFAATGTINFQCETGWLTQSSGDGDLTTNGSKAQFSDANTTLLTDGTGSVETSGGTVTINMTNFRPTDVVGASLAIRISDGSTTVTATVVDIGDDGFPDVLLSDGQGNIDSVEFFGPASGTNFMTLVYNASSDTATLTIQGFGGDTATITSVPMGVINCGVSVTAALANAFGSISFQGPGIAQFPPAVDLDSPWIDFDAPDCGNGAETFPFNSLADGVPGSNVGANISFKPSSTSETATVSKALTFTNADSGSGSVTIGAGARRSTGDDSPRTGFVSRGSKRYRR